MTFAPDRAAYIRSHATLAALAMGVGMAVLFVLGNPHVWTGAIGGLAAVALRGWYLLDEELGHVWTLENGALIGPAGRNVALGDIARLRRLGAHVQVVTGSGDKHLIKFQADPDATITRIDAARPAGQNP